MSERVNRIGFGVLLPTLFVILCWLQLDLDGIAPPVLLAPRSWEFEEALISLALRSLLYSAQEAVQLTLCGYIQQAQRASNFANKNLASQKAQKMSFSQQLIEGSLVRRRKGQKRLCINSQSDYRDARIKFTLRIRIS
jgi:hypothetical protein